MAAELSEIQQQAQAMQHETRPRRISGRAYKPIKMPTEPGELAYKLGSIGCPLYEVAETFGLSVNTFNQHTPLIDAYKKGLDDVRRYLRQLQLKTAEKNPVMQIWLGKQMLNQKDRQELSGPDNGAIKLDSRFEIVLHAVKSNDTKQLQD